MSCSRHPVSICNSIKILPVWALINSDCILQNDWFHWKYLCSNMSVQDSLLAFIRFIIAKFSWEMVVSLLLSPEVSMGFDVAFHFTSSSNDSLHSFPQNLPSVYPQSMLSCWHKPWESISMTVFMNSGTLQPLLCHWETLSCLQSWSKMNVSCTSGLGFLSSEGIFSLSQAQIFFCSWGVVQCDFTDGGISY